MKLLGLIGGVSPQSTAIYYKLLNEAARVRLGEGHSAELLLYTLDFGVMVRLYDEQNWDGYAAEAVKAARCLAAGGAAALVICSNTTHLSADRVEAAAGLPVIHVLDALAGAMDRAGVRRPLLLGTPAVMGGVYYLPALAQRYDGDILVPDEHEQSIIGRVIFDELANGKVRDESRARLLEIVAARDVDGVILGCTELCMILSQAHFDQPAFDTTALHAAAASAYAFGEA